MLILLIRHGRTAWNDAGRIQGRTDVPLSARGRREQRSRAVPETFGGAEAWTSPLDRARETAALLSLAGARADDRLTEMDFGEWEGRTHAELTAGAPEVMRRLEAKGLDMRPPGGETPRQVAARLLDWTDGLTADRVIAVTHKGVIRAAFAAATGWDMTRDLDMKVDWSAGQLFRRLDGGLALERANLELTAR
jgi:probable phosphoglycerate mutase